MADVQFGAQVSAYLTSWDEIRAVAQAMDAGRYDSIWFADHFVPPNRGQGSGGPRSIRGILAGGGGRGGDGHAADRTPGPGQHYRNPGLVAKIAGSVDHISHGRFTLGIGASWFLREHQAYGWDFPSMKERQDRFEEACKMLRSIIHNDGARVTFNGQYYSLDDAPLSPGSYNIRFPSSSEAPARSER